MVLPVSRRVPRVPRYLGTRIGRQSPFAYRAITFFGRTFQSVLLENCFLTPRHRCIRAPSGPATPPIQRTHAYISAVWAVSLSLAATQEIASLSLPPGTKMVHFPGFASLPLCIQRRISRYEPGGVAPFGNLRVKACLAANRSFSLPATSFVASLRLGIHRTPLVA